MKNAVYLIAFCCAFLLSCNNSAVQEENINGNTMLVCKASELTGSVKDFMLSELVESVDIVKLETGDSCLIKRIWKVYVTGSYIGILEHDRRPYKLFDRKGNFISQIGTVGQGPNEYVSIISSNIDEVGKRVYIMPFQRADNLLCYDFEGNPQNPIPLYFNKLDKASFYVDKDIITVFSMPLSNRKVFAFQQNLKGELIKALPPTEEMYAGSYDGEVFTSYNKGVFSVHYTALDTLFHYDPQSNMLIPKYRTAFETDAFAVYGDLPNHFLTFNSIIVDKRTKKANCIKAKNDFLGGMDIGYFQGNNDYLTIVYEAFTFLEELKKNINNPGITKEVRDRMKELLDSIKEDDNPVLVIGKLK
jgi:hypothetical protein